MSIAAVTIYTDGAARGNPGPAAIAAVINDGQGKRIATISRRIGSTTNNQAEYRAIIAALEKAIALGAQKAVINSDSELVVRQVKGQYRVKNAALKPLHQKVIKLAASLASCTINHIPREQNAEADKLANKALDSA